MIVSLCSNLQSYLSSLFFGLMLLLVSILTCSGQTSQKELYKELPHTSFAEKVYLQLDKTIYESNETIWFKGIVTSALNNTPSNLSGILYVELIDASKTIIEEQLLKLNNGIAKGSFALNSQKAGVYLIRAYTKWNENFEDIFMYQQYINIYNTNQTNNSAAFFENITLTELEYGKRDLSAEINPFLFNPKFKDDIKLFLAFDEKEDSLIIKKNKNNQYVFNYPIPEGTLKAKLKIRVDDKHSVSKTVIVDKEFIDLRFFPEGGEMINGLESTLGFKAVNCLGKGVPVKGRIVDENNEHITSFESNYLGMGKLSFIANSNKKYFGVLQDSYGVKLKYPLPKVSHTGTSFQVTEDFENINISIHSNQPKINEDVSIRVRCRGYTHYFSILKLKEKHINKQLLKSEFPEGILEITLFNSALQPICERLFFNSLTKPSLNISVETDTNLYLQRDKTTVNIQVTDKNKTPVNANISVLVINKDLLGIQQNKRQNIYSYFLIESELQGDIEDPGYYFNNQIKTYDLDALMLTQGWRKYNYKTLDKLLSIKPEKELIVSGTVGGLQNEKKSNQFMELTMLTFDNQGGIYTQQVDSTYRFNFSLNNTYSNNGLLEVLFQSKNKNGKQKNYTINVDKKNIPRISYNHEEEEKVDTIIKMSIEKSIANKQQDPFNLDYGTIELNEVLLDGYKLTPEREKVMNLHGKPDVVIENKELIKKIKNWSYGLYSILMFSFPNDIDMKRVQSPHGLGSFLLAQVRGADYTYYLVDGIVVRRQQLHILPDLPPEEIKSVEILRNPKNKAKYYLDLERPPIGYPGGDDAFISIYTNTGNGIFSVQKTIGITKEMIPVFSEQKEFYKPIYENITDEDWNVPDLRSVIHWEPILQTDTLGKTTVEYYNSDAAGDMIIVVECITENGNIEYLKVPYSVKEY